MTNAKTIRRCLCALAFFAGLNGVSGAAAQNASGQGERVWEKLDRAQVVDATYYPEVVQQVAMALARAAPGAWRGVQTNGPYRPGWLNLYTVDAMRIRDEAMLADEGIENFSPESLQSGAMAHEDTGIVFINTAAWRRLSVATVMYARGVHDGLMPAIAAVDVAGIEGTREYWQPATLDDGSQATTNASLLVRGALAFVLAHEMGHLRIGRSPAAEAEVVRLRSLTDRQKDERYACPETLPSAFQAQQALEAAADRAAVDLLGAQCRIGDDGPRRHKIYLLGADWYFTYAMDDRLLQMGRRSQSANIAAALRSQLGQRLYQQAIVERAAEQRRGGVRSVFTTTHPPDYARVAAIEQALRRTPCGSVGLGGPELMAMEMLRRNMCHALVGAR